MAATESSSLLMGREEEEEAVCQLGHCGSGRYVTGKKILTSLIQESGVSSGGGHATDTGCRRSMGSISFFKGRAVVRVAYKYVRVPGI
mmetsp:Transcript_1187/g.2151  ORF Transcript_1187/g.2151 Transcript_1187/m.2151 type:complete len:88 (+) Transcript_1187:124-387(+)